MKKSLLVIAVFGMLTVWLFFHQERFPGWESPNILSASRSRRIQQELFRAAEACRDIADVEMMESSLIKEGFATVDSDPVYPAYLANTDGVKAFAAGADTMTVLKVQENGDFAHMFFARGEEDFLILTELTRNERNEFYVSECTALPLYETKLAEWDTFYYRCYPANDPHYIDYSYFRLTPVDRELYDLTRKYVLPVGYRMVNLFLCDWQENDFTDLNINDVFEYLYEIRTGTPFPWQEYSSQKQNGTLLIPSGMFEETVLAFFDLSREALRSAAHYDGQMDAYPWRPMHGDDLTAWELPVCEPEVTECKENSDGTLLLTVQVASPEQKTNALFTHEVTVRPLQNGSFQYVGNQVTYVSAWGLPPAMARIQPEYE